MTVTQLFSSSHHKLFSVAYRHSRDFNNVNVLSFTDLQRSLETFSKVSQQCSEIWLSIRTCINEVNSVAEIHAAGTRLIAEVTSANPSDWFIFRYRFRTSLRMSHCTHTDPGGNHRAFCVSRCSYYYAWVPTQFPKPGNSSKGDMIFFCGTILVVVKFVTEHRLSLISKLSSSSQNIMVSKLQEEKQTFLKEFFSTKCNGLSLCLLQTCWQWGWWRVQWWRKTSLRAFLGFALP